MVVNIIPKGMRTRVKLMAQLEFELAYFTAIISHFKHYATRKWFYSRIYKWEEDIYQIDNV